MPLRVLALCGFFALAAAVPAAGDTVLERSDAADAAGFIARQTANAVPAEPDSTSRELQLHVDRIAMIAANLESRLRAGEDKKTTRQAYLELRRARLAVISLAIQKRVVLPAVDAVRFEERLDELDRYFADP